MSKSEIPQADPRHFDRIALKWWLCRTEHPFRYVTMDGFWDSLVHAGIAPDDRIEIICAGDAPATHATLVVDEIGHELGRRVKVGVLHRLERQP